MTALLSDAWRRLPHPVHFVIYSLRDEHNKAHPKLRVEIEAPGLMRRIMSRA